MFPWRRRIIGWLALLGAVLYGLLPTAAAFAARPVPVACLTSAAAHQCACRPDPHVKSDCCCKHTSKGDSCTISKLPCDSGPLADGSLSAAANPLTLSTTSVRAPLPATPSDAHQHAAASVRVVTLDPFSPPPRL